MKKNPVERRIQLSDVMCKVHDEMVDRFNQRMQNWANEIPKSRGLTIGKETRWKKGQSGRKVISYPKELDPKV